MSARQRARARAAASRASRSIRGQSPAAIASAGVNHEPPTTAPDYLALANVAVVGGSWLTPADAIAAGDWPRIERLARAAAGLARRG